MIDIVVSGQIRNRKKFTSFTEDCMSWLVPNIRRDVDITVKFVKECENNYLGLCWGDKDVAEIEVAKTFESKTLPEEEIAKTLAHELVHAKQFIKRQLHPNLKWKNQTYTGYKRTPWEKEAYMLEDELFDLFWS